MALAVALSVAAGATDATSFVRLGETFASVMTGNLTLLGLAAARASASLAAHIVVALAGYIVGAAIGARLTRHRSATTEIWPSRVTAVLFIELAAFAGFALGWELSHSRPAGGTQFALLALATLAMGLQAAAMERLGTPLSTTYLTGTLTGAVTSLVSGGGVRHNRASLEVLLAHAAGAAAAGGLILLAPAAVPALPLAAVGAVVVSVKTVGARQ